MSGECEKCGEHTLECTCRARPTMKTAREIIARTYDREQAAQMGEPDPWQHGTDHPEWQGSLGCADVAIAALAAEGFSIVEAGRDPVTIEACAKVADDMFKPEHDFGRVGSLIAHSIRFPPTREGKTE